MEPSVVPPVDPAGRGELDLLDRPPGPLAADQLGLVQLVDRLNNAAQRLHQTQCRSMDHATHRSVACRSSVQNAKWAERFNQTHVAERACVRMYETNQAGLDALPAWLDHCNTSRPHGSLDHRTPMSHLANNVSGSHI